MSLESYLMKYFLSLASLCQYKKKKHTWKIIKFYTKMISSLIPGSSVGQTSDRLAVRQGH